MPPSQLKQLKTSLRDQGLVGPQKSKKQKKLAAKDAAGKQKRSTALQTIRDRFNPFEVKAPARKEKFEVVCLKDGRAAKGVQGRPGVSKGLGEERRRATLLKEIQHRNRVGQILDRRFGENDPSLTPEQRAAGRFARQSERQARKKSTFNLEIEDEDGPQLTHMGRSLVFEEEADDQDDFKEDGLLSSDQDMDLSTERFGTEQDPERPPKRRRLSQIDDPKSDDSALQLPDRKRSKQEVMQEVVAKAKRHKYERQQAKDDDDDLRAELDKGLPDFLQSMREYRKQPLPPSSAEVEISMNPDRAALLGGKDRQEADHEYNERIRQMAIDKRSKPSTRTKTDEEKAEEEASHLRELERKRTRRMEGAPEDSDEDSEQGGEIDDSLQQDDAQAFGLGPAVNGIESRPILDVEDEDDFVLDEDLIASGSEAESAADDDASSTEESSQQDDGDDDFINGLALPPDTAAAEHARTLQDGKSADSTTPGKLPFTYSCPTSHEDFLQITNKVDVGEIPTVVQRIRALYHPKLNAGNKEKLEAFSIVLTEHVAFLADQQPHVPFRILEMLLRHLHSLAKSNPIAVAAAFRAHLREISQGRSLELRPGDFIILTGISTIFPTSDHFHSVVTPAILTIARFLGQSAKSTLTQLAKGAYGCTLALQYQRLSKRYVPEVVSYIQQALALLTNTFPDRAEFLIRTHVPKTALSLALADGNAEPYSSLHFDRLYGKDDISSNKSTAAAKDPSNESFVANNRLKATLISHFLALLSHAVDLWHQKSAFPEIFEPATLLLDALTRTMNGSLSTSSTATTRLPSSLLAAARTLHTKLTTQIHTTVTTTRRPLLLHSHRPLAIKTSIPKFDESYNPDRPRRAHAGTDATNHLDRLKAEHKRERKAAMRELRRDAAFIARHQLRDKRERDWEHDRKMRRLVAEIQGEEGHEKKVYEREKEGRRRVKQRRGGG